MEGFYCRKGNRKPQDRGGEGGYRSEEKGLWYHRVRARWPLASTPKKREKEEPALRSTTKVKQSAKTKMRLGFCLW
jgi:hypothetical protein